MPKAKEIKIEWVHGVSGAIGGQAFLVNANESRGYCITLYGGPEEKVLKAKAGIKTRLPERVGEFILENPGWKQVTKEKYLAVTSSRKTH